MSFNCKSVTYHCWIKFCKYIKTLSACMYISKRSTCYRIRSNMIKVLIFLSTLVDYISAKHLENFLVFRNIWMCVCNIRFFDCVYPFGISERARPPVVMLNLKTMTKASRVLLTPFKSLFYGIAIYSVQTVRAETFTTSLKLEIKHFIVQTSRVRDGMGSDGQGGLAIAV